MRMLHVPPRGCFCSAFTQTSVDPTTFLLNVVARALPVVALLLFAAAVGFGLGLTLAKRRFPPGRVPQRL
jgi:hypothetical protein